jgi:protein required for attachment to host cells
MLRADHFIEHRDPGRVLFIADGVFRDLALPVPVRETVVVGPRFWIKPLLPMLEGDGRFYVLAVTARSARLWRGTRYAFEDVTPTSLPRSVDEVVAETDFEEGMQSMPVARPQNSAGGMAKSHGLESPEEVRKAEFLVYLQRVAKQVDEALGAEASAPLVLVGEPEAVGHLRKLLKHGAVQKAHVDANPQAMSPRDLHDRAYEIVQPLFDAGRRDAEERIRARLGTAEPNVAIRLEEIVSAARFGRVDALLIASDEDLWGRFDEESNTVTARGTPEQDDEDLLNFAALWTLSNGGRVHALKREHLPRQALAAASLRY